MQKETVLILGLGEVGSSLYELFKGKKEFEVYGLDLNKERTREVTNNAKPPSKISVMHVCYRFVDPDKFIKTTIAYLKIFKPRLTIIESTVAPGTTQKIAKLSKTAMVNSPIRGMHESKESMKRDMLFWTKYVGGTTKETALAAQRHFEKLGLKVKVLKSPAETELAKLFETTYRAWMIACFQEMHRISRHYGADFDQVLDMMEDIHRHRFNKPLHYPDVIGGHCLIPNTELLEKAYDSEFLRLILKSNKEREKEIKDKNVRAEIDKIKTRVKRLEKDLVKLADEKHASCKS
ncbi:MAG TPA: GDP-mannose dehydrogenase [Candidatus Bathyarchaeia archaeon]|jgi:UDP-N-acetyl-D-mannosaminuronate dehydrogenase|nr:GDP-mannose dehydrogenase [Candidatus Bathyarchaeia archaeon]